MILSALLYAIHLCPLLYTRLRLHPHRSLLRLCLIPTRLLTPPLLPRPPRPTRPNDSTTAPRPRLASGRVPFHVKQQQRRAAAPHRTDPFTLCHSDHRRRRRRPRCSIPMWRRGAHADAAHHLPTAGPGASAAPSSSSSPAAGAARRRRRPGLSCRPSHLFFALLVALFTASLLVVWQLLPIGDGDGDAAAEGDGEPPPPLPEGGDAGVMRFSSSRVALRAFDGESRLEAARSERRRWASLAPVRVALVSAPLLTCAVSPKP